MNEFNTLTWSIESPVVLLVFVIVLAVCLRVLPEMGFDGFSSKVLALCVAVLSAMGLLMYGPGGAPDGALEPWPDYFFLLPYAALGLTLLLLPLLFFLFGCLERFKECFRRERKPSQHPKEWPAYPNPEPSVVKDKKDFNPRACGYQKNAPDRDQVPSGKRNLKQ